MALSSHALVWAGASTTISWRGRQVTKRGIMIYMDERRRNVMAGCGSMKRGEIGEGGGGSRETSRQGKHAW
jgi:hypothetical protein